MAVLDDLLLFKETVLATQVQILVGIKPNIKTEDEADLQYLQGRDFLHRPAGEACEGLPPRHQVLLLLRSGRTQCPRHLPLHEVRSADDEPPKKVKRQPVTFENLLKQFKKAAQKTTPDQVPLIEEMRRRHLLVCSICNDNAEYENMYYVFIHMMQVHNTRGFITCCGRRLAQKPYAYQSSPGSRYLQM